MNRPCSIPAILSTARALPVLLGALLSPAIAQDVIYLKNGDRITGQIRRMEQGQIVMEASPAFFGFMHLDWSHVARIESERTFQFQTTEGERLQGHLSSTETGAEEIVVTDNNSVRNLNERDVVLMKETNETLPGLLRANAGAGLTLTRANHHRQFTADVEISYESTGYTVVGWAHSIYSSQSGAADTNRHNFGAFVGKPLNRRWSLVGISDFLISDEQQLDLRTTLGGGPARDIIRNNKMELVLAGGTAWTRENYAPGAGAGSDNQGVEGFAAVQFSFFRFRQWQLDSTFLLYPGITRSGRVRADWSTTLSLRLIPGKPLWWNLNQSLNLDNKPPPNASGTDYVTSTTLSWTFP
jgi:uncharacterized protein DUF481